LRRTAKSLTKVEAGQLHKGIVSFLNRALECCLRPAPDFAIQSGGFRRLKISFVFAVAAETIANGATWKCSASNKVAGQFPFAAAARSGK
jgi:hypothetical protein